MINEDSTIPCPVCKIPIPFNVHSLLAGVSFSCPKCLASVGLTQESKSIVGQTVDRLERIKQNKR